MSNAKQRWQRRISSQGQHDAYYSGATWAWVCTAAAVQQYLPTDLERLEVLEGVEFQGRDETPAFPVVILAAHQVRENPAGKQAHR